MKTILGWSLFLFLFVLVLVAGINEKSLFQISSIQILPEMKASDKLVWEEINKNIESTLAVYKEKKIWNISLLDIKRQLLSYPYLQKVEVQKVWPNKLEVSYALPELKAIHQVSGGKYQILLEDGKWLGPLSWSRLPALPWVRGDWVTKKVDKIPDVLRLLGQLPKKGPLAVDQVSEIQFSDLDGFFLTLIKTGQQIRFGTDDFELKSLRGLQVLEYLQGRGLESRVIDLNFSKKVLVRLRNHP